MAGEITVAVASRNAAKIAATVRAFSMKFGAVAVQAHEAPSMVTETPTTDEEAIAGCLQRLQTIGFPSECKYTVALEGLLQQGPYGAYVYGWAVIRARESEKISFGCSGKVMVPPHLLRGFNASLKLSEHILSQTDSYSTSDFEKIGTNGVITNGLYTREDEFTTSILCALGYITNINNFHTYDVEQTSLSRV